MADKKATKISRKKNPTSKPKSKPMSKKSMDNAEFQGLIPALYGLVNLLPENMKPHGERIVGIFTIAIIAIFTILILGAIVATVMGRSDLIMTIFQVDVIGVACCAVAAIVFTTKKSING